MTVSASLYTTMSLLHAYVLAMIAIVRNHINYQMKCRKYRENYTIDNH